MDIRSHTDKTAVLLLAHGTPESVDGVPEFLLKVTGGRPLPPQVVEEIQHRYRLIGRSPLTEYTMKQAEALSRELKLRVYVGMRNWKPFIADAVHRMAADGVQRAIAICLAPHDSRTSVGLYRKAVLGEGAQPPFQVEFIDNWHDHPLLARAFAEKLRAGWERACREMGARVPVIFTAHSVPQRTIAEGDPYEQQARETAALVAVEVPTLTMDDWTFAFQSQGMSGGAWLGPTVEETILQLKAKGRGGVFIQPIGFLCDHVEVLYDVDIMFREFAEKNGVRLWRAESLNDSPILIAALADVARSRLGTGEPDRGVVQIRVQ
ncbi:MAG TPA: ferrochelatase [Terriglobales bacterium]|nr:ferrochelatase [Terriglobales bacterium]